MIEKRVWAVVADGARARILKNIGHSTDASMISLEADKTPVGELMSDQAGRTFSSVGNSRSAMAAASDPVRENEKAFADQLSTLLEKSRRENAIDSLIVVAAPRTLGDLRLTMSPQLQKIVDVESNKDLTGLPSKALYEAVEKLRRN